MSTLKDKGLEALEFFLYVVISLFLLMLTIVLGFSVIVVIGLAINNLTYAEKDFLGLVQLLVFVPIMGGFTSLIAYVRYKWFRFRLF